MIKSHDSGINIKIQWKKPIFGLELSGRISRGSDIGTVRAKRKKGPDWQAQRPGTRKSLGCT